MSALKDIVIRDTLDRVQIVYLNRDTAKWWNGRRQVDDTAVFCGWYWVRDETEAGPFKTRSAALSNAYYTHVLGREPPSVGHSMLPGFKRKKVKERA